MSVEGDLIAERYRLGRRLGSGGSAEVFHAIDERTGAALAVKVLHAHLSERPAARHAFLAEAERAERLRHPNIVGVLAWGADTSGDRWVTWIALELAVGDTLSAHVSRRGPLPPAEAIATATGVLWALQEAHANGLIHRDVSPSNVMVAPDDGGVVTSGGVRLLDFGLADAVGMAAVGTDDLLSAEATGRSGVIGNVNYMSPEQVRGMPVDERGDIYQAGAVLFFALTGRAPFVRDTTGQVMRAHLDTQPPAPSTIDPLIPRELDRVVVRAMLKNPAERFPSAAAMLTALAAIEAEGLPGVELRAARNVPGPALVLGEEKTLVLGRTVVPPRLIEASPAVAHTLRLTRGSSRAGAWLAAVLGVAAVALAVFFAAHAAPTSPAEAVAPTVSAVPSASPQATPTVRPTTVTAPATPAAVVVPDLSGTSYVGAVERLTGAGLIAGEVTPVDAALARDTVLESVPGAGASVERGSAVALTIASGSNTIPDVTGFDRAAATSALESAGFLVTFAVADAGTDAAAGTAVRTAPGAGAGLSVGGTVTVFEARPPTPTPTPTVATPTPTATSTAEPNLQG